MNMQIQELEHTLKEYRMELKEYQKTLKSIKKSVKLTGNERKRGKTFHQMMISLTNPLVRWNQNLTSQLNKSPTQIKLDKLLNEAEKIRLKAIPLNSYQDKEASEVVLLAGKHVLRLQTFLEKNSDMIESENDLDIESKVRALQRIIEQLRPPRNDEDNEKLEKMKSLIDETLKDYTSTQ